jgi:hypothetical protein
MADQKIHHVAPSVRETAFNCPHCGALTTQTWFKIYATDIGEDEARLPRQVSEEEASLLTFDQIEDAEQRKELKDWFAKMALGVPFLDRLSSSAYSSWAIYNLNVSRCFNCKRLAVWVGDNLAWPVAGEAPAANADLPEDVSLDYEEASRILNLSPRGAAALLRLAIQKLCIGLGGKGKKLDDDIAELVKQGLDLRVQRALDIVRVIGNNAVHPGQVDLKDNRAVAEKLFVLVNLIADKMITQPRAVDALYLDLPEASRQAIERRDAPPPKGGNK